MRRIFTPQNNGVCVHEPGPEAGRVIQVLRPWQPIASPVEGLINPQFRIRKLKVKCFKCQDSYKTSCFEVAEQSEIDANPKL